MLFNSFTYLLFLPAVVALHWLLPDRYRRGLLLIASYVFYMNWMPSYGALIALLTVANYAFGQAIERSTSKKPWLVASLIFNLGTLCFFKYANLLVSSVWNVLSFGNHVLHVPPVIADQSPALTIILPLGISFFTFEFIHYTVDVYRGSPCVKNFWNFALFASFFPSQIAGPIKRYQNFNEQLKQKLRFNSAMFKDGCSLILLGLYKKMVLGDNLGFLVSTGFSHPLAMGTADAWLAAVGYTVQIYVDFSGYTDIGRGSAMLLGYKLPINFNWPFMAASLDDFWRRWHISLSTWLRDYLYIPMGGSRVSNAIMKRNLLITMALGGLWHGADWRFLIWGLCHGIGLLLTKDWFDLVERTPVLKGMRQRQWWHWTGVFITFNFVMFAFILFRAENVNCALQVLQRMFTACQSGPVVEVFLQSTLPFSLVVYAIFLCAQHLVSKPGLVHHLTAPVRFWYNSSIPARVAVFAALSMAILGFAPEHAAPFIYFQF